MLYTTTFATPIGELFALASIDSLLVLLPTSSHQIAKIRMCYEKNNTLQNNDELPLFDTLKQELEEYFVGKRKTFSVHTHPSGAFFERSTWRALETIPYGEIISYGEQASILGNEKAYRAVGTANSHNPIIILTPCHRVCKKDGTLGGYSCGVDIKKQLLTLEKKYR